MRATTRAGLAVGLFIAAMSIGLPSVIGLRLGWTGPHHESIESLQVAGVLMAVSLATVGWRLGRGRGEDD
jgi:hypothetical protein